MFEEFRKYWDSFPARAEIVLQYNFRYTSAASTISALQYPHFYHKLVRHMMRTLPASFVRFPGAGPPNAASTAPSAQGRVADPARSPDIGALYRGAQAPMGSHSLQPTLQENDFRELATMLGAKSEEAVYQRLYSNGKDGLHLYRVPELKSIAQYLKKILNVHVSGFSSMNKKDLVDWISGVLYRQDQGGGHQKARVQRPLSGTQNHYHSSSSSHQSSSHSSHSHAAHFELIAARITPNPFFEVVQTLAVKDVMATQVRLSFTLDQTWNSPFHGKPRAVHARIFEPLEAWAAQGQRMKETAWVTPAGLYVNNNQVVGLPKKRKQPHIAANSNYATPPVVLDRYVYPGHNSVAILTAGERFWFIVQVGSVRSVEEVQSEILGHGEDTGPCSGRRILQKLLGESESDDIACTDLEVSLRCPLSMLRIGLPAKGRNCTHLQCFDLSTFLEYAKKHSFWLCPNCHKPLPPSELRVCSLFNEIIQTVSSEADKCKIDPDGSFREVTEDDRSAALAEEEGRKAKKARLELQQQQQQQQQLRDQNPGLDMLALVAAEGDEEDPGNDFGAGFLASPERDNLNCGDEVIILDSDED